MNEIQSSLIFDESNTGIDNKDLNIIFFEGNEAVSNLYRFELTVAIAVKSDSSHWDKIVKLLNTPGTLILDYHLNKLNQKEKLKWHGVITSIVQDGRDNQYCYYKVILEPAMAKLQWMFCSDVYLDKQLDEVIKDVMVQSDFKNMKCDSKSELKESDNFEYWIDVKSKDKFSNLLKKSHQKFTCQFEESYLDFIQRRTEFYGVHYTFSQLEKNACMVFSYDLNVPEKNSAQFLQAEYNPAFGSDVTHDAIAVTHLSKGLHAHANQLHLQRRPTYFNTTDERLLPASHQLDKHQFEVGLYSTQDQFELSEDRADNGNVFVENRRISGQYLAGIRSAAIQSKQAQVTGVATTPGMMAGKFIHINDQFVTGASYQGNDDNQRKDDYFVLSVKHRWGSPDKAKWQNDKANLQSYQADFVLHPCFADDKAPVPFYPQQTTNIPRIESMVSGFVDGVPYKTQDNPHALDTIDTTYPNIDEFGRYRVRFAFAKQLQASYEKNSAWLRLATPFAGGTPHRDFDKQGNGKNSTKGYDYSGGMHFPLRAGTEVLISFVNGDPDYPVIVSALANDSSPSPVARGIKDSNGKTIRYSNSNQFVLQTPVGNRMTVNDVAKEDNGGQWKDSPYSSWSMYSPAMNSQFQLGGYRYKGNDKKTHASSGFMLSTKGQGVIQSDEMLYLKSKQGVKIMSGNHSPEEKFGALLHKASKMSLAATPAEGPTKEDFDKLKEDFNEYKEDAEEKTGEYRNKKESYERYEKARKKRMHEPTENATESHWAAAKETFAGIDVDFFAGGAKIDGAAAALIADVKIALAHIEVIAGIAKLDISLLGKSKEINFHEKIAMYLNKKNEAHSDVAHEALTSGLFVDNSSEILGKQEKLIGELEEQIKTATSIIVTLNQSITNLSAIYDEASIDIINQYTLFSATNSSLLNFDMGGAKLFAQGGGLFLKNGGVVSLFGTALTMQSENTTIMGQVDIGVDALTVLGVSAGQAEHIIDAEELIGAKAAKAAAKVAEAAEAAEAVLVAKAERALGKLAKNGRPRSSNVPMPLAGE